MRGEHERAKDGRFPILGSSPHARGTQITVGTSAGSDRIIPACAGNTIRNAFAGLGFNSTEDVFQRMFSGEMGRRAEIGDEAAGQGAAFQEGKPEPLRTQGIPKSVGQAIYVFRNDRPMKAHPRYKAAKAGDWVAAADLVEDLVPQSVLDEAVRRFGDDAIYVPVHAEEAAGQNAIPALFAALMAARSGGRVEDRVVQTARAFHTGADPMQRLVSRPLFGGLVERGGRYVLVDDVSVLGGTLAELANHIRAGGGEVVGIATLVNASRTGLYVPKPQHVKLIEGRFGDVVREEFGVEPGALTADEAQYLANFPDADALRDRIAKTRLDGRGEVRSGSVRQEDLTDDETRFQVRREDAEKALVDATGTLDKAAKDDVPVRGADRFYVRDLGLLKRLFVHPRTIAAFHKEFVPVFLAAKDQFQARDQMAAELADAARPYFDLPVESKKKVDAVLELGRLQKSSIPRDRLTAVKNEDQPDAQLSKPGDVLRLTGDEAAGYVAVRKSMNMALDLFKAQVIEDGGLDPEKVKSATDVLQETGRKSDPAEKEKLQELARRVREIEQAKRQGYVPGSSPHARGTPPMRGGIRL